MKSLAVSDRVLGIFFVILATLATIHILGKRLAEDAKSHVDFSRPSATQQAESNPSPDRPAS
jgi:hypothetical protein